MPEFIYKAQESGGDIVEGIVEAENAGEATTILSDKGLNVVSLLARETKTTIDQPIQLFVRVKQRDIVIFSRQFAVLVAANVAIVESLRIVARQTTNSKLRMILGEVADEVESGTKLSAALGKRDKIFSLFYVNMIRSGETSGRLDEVLNYLADQMEKDFDLSSRVKGSMYYPAFIIVGMFVAGFVMMAFVIPKLTEVFAESGTQLPFSTRVLIAVASFMAAYWWLIAIVAIGGVVWLVWWFGTEGGSRVWGFVSIRIPIFGQIFQKLAIVKVLRSMKTLLEGGVDTVTALEISADVSGNALLKDILLKASKDVRDGQPISVALSKETRVVPIMVSQMIAVGEDTGKLTEIIDRLSSFYSREIDNLIGGLVTLIEPVIIVIIGLVVAFMVSAIMLPLYNMSQNF
jgi:type II secretory pathway component PulF